MKRRYFIEAAVVLVFGIALLWWRVPAFLNAQNILTPRYFPDDVFRKYLIELFHGSLRGVEAAKFDGGFEFGVESVFGGPVQADRVAISTLKGIEFFPNLTRLRLCNSQVTEIDLSKNVNLNQLTITNNPIDTIDLSHQIHLRDLIVSNLSNLDLSNNIELEYIHAQGFQKAQHLDLKKLSRLKTLIIRFPVRKKIDWDFSGNPELELLALDGVETEAIDLTPLKKLRSLGFARMKVSMFDVSQNPALEDLFFNNCSNVSELVFRNNPNLAVISCNHSNIHRLDVRDCPWLKQLDCEGNFLTELDLSNNRNLMFLFLKNNRFTHIPDVSFLSNLHSMDMRENLLGLDDLDTIRTLYRRIGFPAIEKTGDNRLMSGFACVPVKDATDPHFIEALAQEGETPVSQK